VKLANTPPRKATPNTTRILAESSICEKFFIKFSISPQRYFNTYFDIQKSTAPYIGLIIIPLTNNFTKDIFHGAGMTIKGDD
jgi:hypothetical protein